MMSLYDEEEVMRSYIKSERYEAIQETAQETALRMLKRGKMTIQEIAEDTGLSIEAVEQLAGLQTV